MDPLQTGIGPEILESLVELMTSMGASYAEARLHIHSGFTGIYHDNKPISLADRESAGVAFRAIVDGGLGFSSTNKLTQESMKTAALLAVRAARNASKLVKTPIGVDDSRLGRARVNVWEKKPLESLEGFDRASEVLERVSGIEVPKGLDGAMLSLFYIDDIEYKILVTSDGARIESRIPRIYIAINALGVASGSRRNFIKELGGSGGLELLDELNLEKEASSAFKSLYIALVKAKPAPHGRMDIVLSPSVTGLIAHEAAGHPSEADRILGREAAQAGLSYRIEKRTGERIGSSALTIVDDPTIPGSLGFYVYDDEGVPARPRILIDRGVLNELLHNRETARLYGVRSNAAARAKEYWAEPIVRMANTYIAPGDYSFEELLEDVKDGVYIKEYQEWNIDDYRWGQRYVGLEAYRIKNGRIEEPVKDPVLETNTKELFTGIDAVGRDLVFSAGICGKGEPPQGVPVWFGGPHVRVRGARIW